jgi:YD repeat-containing protein
MPDRGPSGLTARPTSAAFPYSLSVHERDKLGRIVRKSETVQGLLTVFDFTYDEVGQLIQVMRNGTATTTYKHDLVRKPPHPSQPLRRRNQHLRAQDRLVSSAGASYGYTAAGELVTRTEGGQTTSHTYDELGNLLAVTKPDSAVIGYRVDSTIQRMAKAVNGTVTREYLWE